MRIVIILLLGLLSAWLASERHSLAAQNAELEQKLSTAKRGQEAAAKKLSEAETRAEYEAQLAEAKIAEARALARAAAQPVLVPTPVPTPAPTPAPEKKTWLQERIEQGGSLTEPPRVTNPYRLYYPPAVTRRPMVR